MKTYLVVLMISVLLTAIHFTSMPDKQSKQSPQ